MCAQYDLQCKLKCKTFYHNGNFIWNFGRKAPPPKTDIWWQVSKSVISVRVPEGVTSIYFASHKREL